MAKLSSKSLWFAGCLGAVMLWSGLANAGIVITGSRVVYLAKDREVSVKMTNNAEEPSLVQAWVDKGNEKLTPDKADGPFLITPPITRVEPKKGQTLRLVYTGDEAASKKQESVFWLNVLDVPPMPKDKDANFMQVAVRSRLKIFYRPDDLPGTPAKSAEELKWSVVQLPQGYGLRARNDAAYHVSLSSISFNTNGKSFKVKPEDVKMVAPGASIDFPVQGLSAAPGPGSQVDYQWVNDWGSSQKLETKI
ncbi:chaperone protein EcpD [Pseudomonas nitritireducens]|uniref:Chaperone protein EcpD n=1 Tax=Pseudomonas nitroreducens TaxID=46680 RepID=A0A7W7P2W0_PSENT|nr:fimbria/pilus periplasmic chaperone [Pseudomonas nitritireducens]MBB4866046.1 chaperone protein EcpD [Pseudomonas nitritireducens]